MAQSHITMTVRIADAERFRLFVWELTQLWFRMRLINDPHAEELGRIIERFNDGGDDEHEPTR